LIAKGNEDVKAEHGQIGNAEERVVDRTRHPDAQAKGIRMLA